VHCHGIVLQEAARAKQAVRMNLVHDGIVSNAVVKMLGLEGKLAAEADAVRAEEERHLGFMAASYAVTLNCCVGHLAALMVRGRARHAWGHRSRAGHTRQALWAGPGSILADQHEGMLLVGGST
jgi:hypothetical protein